MRRAGREHDYFRLEAVLEAPLKWLIAVVVLMTAAVVAQVINYFFPELFASVFGLF